MNRAKWLAALLTGATAMTTVPVVAQTTAVAPQQIAFNVDAQDLKAALDQFAQQSDADLVYDPALVRGLRSTELRGRFVPVRGLERLLTGTGLRIRQVEPRVFSIQSASAATDNTGSIGTTPVQGVVTAAANDWALPGARLVIDGTDLATIADERGRFFFPEVPVSATSITVEYLGQSSASFPLAADSEERQRVALKLGGVSAEIVVLGYSSAIQRALNQQLRADNSATIVSSDLLGSFPAETVSEALRRLPGVAFGRSEETGEGERITVRGFSSEAINIQLNGLDLQGTGFERTIDLSGFLAENISQVTIQKSLLPSHQATGSGGLVEIETKSGLDYGKFALNFGIEGETGFDRAFGNEFQVNGNERRFTRTDRRDFDPILDVGGLIPTKTVEENRAGYVEAKFTLANFELIGGARFESRFRSGRSLTSPSVRTAANILEPRETFVNAGLVAFTELSGTQTTLTPSVILNYRPQDNLVARFAYFRSTVNPDFRLLRRSRQISIDLRPTINRALITEANPDLRPTKTDNFDIDLSYYFTDSPGLIRAGFFYKKVSNNFTNVFFQAGGDDDVRQEILASFGALATARPELVAFNASTSFERNRPENGAGGKIYGFELELIRKLSFLPGFLSDFGVLGNLTYTKSRFPTLLSGRNDDGTLGSFTVDRPFEDQAALVYNASLNYEKDGSEGRLIYTRQSASPSSFEIHGLDTIVPAYATLDMRLSYSFDTLGAGWTVFLQGDDLLRGSTELDIRSAVSSRFNGGDAEFFFPDRYLFTGGRTISAGFRARF
ncbi:MAG: TonB-dependent receptor plug domain-containing protein [Sphingopyxis sp.]|nr:TonB-dependent receptor plug domain-containing protein [Sphingopyxis sp.]